MKKVSKMWTRRISAFALAMAMVFTSLSTSELALRAYAEEVEESEAVAEVSEELDDGGVEMSEETSNIEEESGDAANGDATSAEDETVDEISVDENLFEETSVDVLPADEEAVDETPNDEMIIDEADEVFVIDENIEAIEDYISLDYAGAAELTYNEAYASGFITWFNTDGATAVEAGQYGDYPIYVNEKMSAKTNKITVGGTDYYSVQGSANPKANGNNPNGAIPDSGAFISVLAPADGILTVYGYAAAGKPFYATKGATATIVGADCFNNATHSHMVTVKAGEVWYFYAQGSKAQFCGVEFSLPKPSKTINITWTGADLGTAKVTFKNDTTGAEVQVGAGDSTVELQESYSYTISIDDANKTIDKSTIDLSDATVTSITINVETAAKHEVSGDIKGLPAGATVTKITFTDESNASTDATVSGNTYSVSLKNGNYTASATVTGADGYTVYDHVAVSGTQGEAITNDVWFYGTASAYSTTYVATITAGVNGDYKTITEAVAAAKAMTRTAEQYVTIELLDDKYTEQVIVNTPNIKLVGTAGKTPVITWYYGIGYKYYSIDSTGYYNVKNANDKFEMNYAQRWGCTVRVTASGFKAENIYFQNSFNLAVVDYELGDSAVGNAAEYGQGISGSLQHRVSGLDVSNTTNVERAAAIAIDADMAEFYNCKFVSSQDTVYTGSGKAYFNKCYIAGQTDYIFGNTGCAAVFDDCDLAWLGYTGASAKEGYITATRGSYLFRGCRVVSGASASATIKPGYFGRPWGNTATVYFVGTSVGTDESGASYINADGWYAMSGVNPADATFREYGNCLGNSLSSDKTKFFYTTYSDDCINSDFALTKAEAESMADPANDNAFLGTWVPQYQITEAFDLSAVAEWNYEADDEGDDNHPSTGIGIDQPGTITNTYVLQAASGDTFSASNNNEGVEAKAGTDNYFTLIYSAKSKIDTSSKTWEDGFSAGVRYNFGGAVSTTKNAVKITTTTSNAVVKIWWVEGGDDNRQMAILNAQGSKVAVTEGAHTKNSTYKDTFTLENAGTYYIGGETNSNYIFKIEVTESVTYVWEETAYVLETSSLTAFAAGAKADGDSEKAGTDNYFTVIYSAKSKVDSNTKEFEDGYSSGQRINFGGVVSTTKNAVKITTTCANAKVKFWWVAGDNSRQMAVMDASGTVVAKTDVGSVKNSMYISELTIPAAGTYYLGGSPNNNYIFKIQVTEKKLTCGVEEQEPRKAWADVAAPVINSAAQSAQNPNEIKVNVSMVVGYDGADKVSVAMYDSDNNLVATKNSSAEKNDHDLVFTPSKSGTYTFKAVAVREEETDKSAAQNVDAAFILPLKAPSVTSATNKGEGSVEITWTASDEASFYIVTVDGVETTIVNDGTSAVLTGLTVGNTYTIGVKAARSDNDKTAIGATVSVTVKDEAERTWSFAAYGSSTDTSHNGYTGSANDGNLVVYSESGKGKITPNSTDGIAYYYTVMNPETENFTLEADITVSSWTYSNGQEGFGIMVSDSVGTHGDSSDFWNNSIMAVATKVEYYYDGTGVTNDTTAQKVTLKLGLGSLVRLGVTAADVASFKSTGQFNGAAVPAGFTTATTPLIVATSSANLIGGCTNAPANTIANPLTTYHLSVRRDNTGYLVTYTDASGTVVGQKRIYDENRDLLTQIESDKIYVGFFASRNARISVTNINLTTVAPEDDDAAESRETEYIIPVYTIESATVSNSDAYDLVYYGNADGVLSITDNKGNIIADNVAVTANTKHHFAATTAMGDTVFTVTMKPNADYVPGPYKLLSDYSEATFTHVVNRKAFSVDYIYVSPNGSASGSGTKSSPVDIYTAVKCVSAGQTIVLMGGKYNLSSTVKVERGIDGTASSLISMIADPEGTERPVFDFGKKCAGMILAGNYWYFQGFDVTNSSNGQKGIQVSGKNNTLDGIRAYRNGNTGIQISRYLSTDGYADWPANNLILNCTSFLNADSGYEDADGFAAKLTVGDGNVFDGCIAAYNADDGWDLFAKPETGSIGSVTIKNSVAFMNGYDLADDGSVINAGNGNGFKMGGSSLSGYHTLINSVAFANKAKGIDSNSCPDIQVYNCTSFDNESYNVAFYTNTAVNTDFLANGLISYKVSNDVAEQFKLKGSQDNSKVYGVNNYYAYGKENSYNSANTLVAADWFVSLDMTTVIACAEDMIQLRTFGLYGVTSVLNANAGIVRNADGTINMNGFLTLTDNAATDSGANVEGASSASKDYATGFAGNNGESGNSGSGDSGSGNSGSGNSGSGNSGSGNSESGNTGNSGSGNTGTGNSGSSNNGSGNGGAGNSAGNTGNNNTGNASADNTTTGNTTANSTTNDSSVTENNSTGNAANDNNASGTTENNTTGTSAEDKNDNTEASENNQAEDSGTGSAEIGNETTPMDGTPTESGRRGWVFGIVAGCVALAGAIATAIVIFFKKRMQ